MLNLLIVDDEYYSREGIKQILLSRMYNVINKVSDAKNALEAIDLCKSEHIDLVITDINMPHIDGLDMIETIQNISPKTQFICITGHNDFSYAHRSVKLQVSDFILKPIDADELVASVNIAWDTFNNNKQRDWQNAEKEITALLYGRHYDENDVYLQEIVSPPIICAAWNCEEIQSSFDAVSSAVNIMLDGQPWLSHQLSNRSYLLLCYGNDKYISGLTETFQKNLTQWSDSSAAITVSNTVNNMFGAVSKLQLLLNDAFFFGKKRIIMEPFTAELPFDESTVEEQIHSLIASLHHSNRDMVLKESGKLFSLFFKMKIPHELLKKYMLKIIIAIREQMNKRGIESKNEDSSQIILNATSLDEMQFLFESSLSEISNRFIEHSYLAEDSPVVWAIRYITENFQKDVSLAELASMAHVNCSYLSRSIKNELGMNYSKYLLKLRMEKAVQLLLKGMSVQQISLEMGYLSYRSFSTQFKNYFDCSPRDYLKYHKM